MAYWRNTIYAGFGWAQDISVEGALPGDVMVVTLRRDEKGKLPIEIHRGLVVDGVINVRLDGEQTATFAKGQYEWQLGYERDGGAGVFTSLPPVQVAAVNVDRGDASGALLAPGGEPLAINVGPQADGLVVRLETGVQGVRGAMTLSGDRAPLPEDGEDGDFWIDTSASPKMQYGPKAGGAWPAEGWAVQIDPADVVAVEAARADATAKAAAAEASRIAAATAATGAGTAKTGAETARTGSETALSATQAVQTAVTQLKLDVQAQAELWGSFTTLALANAALASIPADRAVTVTADGTNNGFYVKRSGVLVRDSLATVPALDVRQAVVESTLPGVVSKTADITQINPAVDYQPLLAVGLDSNPKKGILVDRISKTTGQRTMLDVRAEKFSSPQTDPLLPLIPGIPYDAATIDDWLSLTIDGAGAKVWGIKQNGMHVQRGGGTGKVLTTADLPSTAYSFDATTGLTFPFDDTTIYMFIVRGQSYANAQTQVAGDALFSPDALHPGYSLMPDIGPWPNGRDFTDFADLKEVLYTYIDPSRETMCSRFASTIQNRLQAAFGRKQQILMAVAAQGTSEYVKIKRGQPAYTDMLRLVAKCTAIAAARGKRLVVMAQLWPFGESDTGIPTTADVFARYLKQEREFAETDIRKLTGQSEPLRLFTYQVLRGGRASNFETSGQVFDPLFMPTVGLGQAQAAAEDPMITCIGPIYYAPENPNDNIHLAVAGRVQYGEHFADVVCREMWGSGFTPLGIIEAWRTSSVNIRVRYNRAVTADISGTIVKVSDLPGFGFELIDGAQYPPLITEVAAVSGQPTMLDLKLASASAGTRSFLQYAARINSFFAGNQGGARGCVREPTSYMTSATGVPLYHWAKVQRIPIQ